MSRCSPYSRLATMTTRRSDRITFEFPLPFSYQIRDLFKHEIGARVKRGLTGIDDRHCYVPEHEECRLVFPYSTEHELSVHKWQ